MRGFSLVELSIVLVILGLLTGGILAGQNLIRAAELRSIVSDYNATHAAMRTFQDKYFALPGDFKDATKFWGEMGDAGPGSCPDTQGTGTETCNGDGDGMIGASSGTSMKNREVFLAWQHMANAGLVPGNFSGVTGTAGSLDYIAGENLPRCKLSDCMVKIWYFNFAGDANYFATDNGHQLRYTNSGGFALIKAEEAWSIDTKMDDGQPHLGAVTTPRNNTNCVNTSSVTEGSYNLSADTIACALHISLDGH